MYRKSILTLLFITVAFTAGAVAQANQITGTVELSRNAGKTPIAGAKVDLFPEDVKGKGQSVQTDAEGKFTFSSLEADKLYILSISAPGAAPTYLDKMKAGMVNVLITMEVGDGKSVTEDELKTAMAQAASGMSAEEKKKLEEAEKKRREVEERNQRAEQNNRIFETSLKEGEALFKQANYTEAIAKFDTAINASPDYEGTAPVFLNYKAVALKNRARKLIVDAQKGDAAARNAARDQATPDYHLALQSYDRGLAVIEKAPMDSPAKASLPGSKKNLYHNYVITLGEMYETSVPVPEGTDAAKAVAGFIETETDAKKRAAVLASFGEKAMRGGELEGSALAFKKVLESTPNDPDALGGAAIAYGAMAFMSDPPNAEHLKLARQYAQDYTKSAPKDHRNQAAVQDLMENLKAIK
jgi:tetratricopeptide (TPR) repeat protein